VLKIKHNSGGDGTRQLSYQKDDRAMRPIYGCPEKFRESSQMPPATCPEICNCKWTMPIG